MIVIFQRTGERRYAVEAHRPGLPDVVMNPAPGYDRLVPHDMMHLVVEAQLGLKRGVFGQLAAGGDAGTFHVPMNSGESSRKLARVRKRVKGKGSKLLREGRDECARSERATYICWYEWLARSSSSDRKNSLKRSKNWRGLEEKLPVTRNYRRLARESWTKYVNAWTT